MIDEAMAKCTFNTWVKGGLTNLSRFNFINFRYICDTRIRAGSNGKSSVEAVALKMTQLSAEFILVEEN